MRMSQELKKHTVWLHRTISPLDTDDDNKCPVFRENKRRLNLLVTELKVREILCLRLTCNSTIQNYDFVLAE